MDTSSTPAVTDADRQLADGKRITLQPLHQTVEVENPAEETRMTENASIAQFDFDTETTREQAVTTAQEVAAPRTPHPAVAITIVSVAAAVVIAASVITFQAIA